MTAATDYLDTCPRSVGTSGTDSSCQGLCLLCQGSVRRAPNTEMDTSQRHRRHHITLTHVTLSQTMWKCPLLTTNSLLYTEYLLPEVLRLSAGAERPRAATPDAHRPRDRPGWLLWAFGADLCFQHLPWHPGRVQQLRTIRLPRHQVHPRSPSHGGADC